jgi:hypothetical protein
LPFSPLAFFHSVSWPNESQWRMISQHARIRRRLEKPQSGYRKNIKQT